MAGLMWALATCRAAIYRGFTTDPRTGDKVPSTTPVVADTAAEIIERDARLWDQTTQTPRVVRVVSGKVGAGVDVQIGDRIRDLTHGVTYVVDNVTLPRAAGRAPDTVLALKRVN